MNDKYHLKLPLKTKVLNVFRRVFMSPSIENWLANKIEKTDSGFYKKLVPPDYLYKTNSWRKVERNGLKYKLDISHVVDHYLFFHVKDSTFQNFIDAYVKPGSFVLDIGANIGTTITRMAAKVGNDGRVIGFEPNLINFQRASNHIQLNELTNCKVENLGLGDKPGVLKLYKVNEHNPGMNRILLDKEEAGEYAYDEVQVITLDDYFDKNELPTVNAVKIDVEGFEYFVLKGSAKILAKDTPALFMEINYDFLKDNHMTPTDVFELLYGYGYNTIVNSATNKRITADEFVPGMHLDIICTKA